MEEFGSLSQASIHDAYEAYDELKAIISKLRGEQPSKLCPCHNEPCVWTSYNPELWNEPKKDHYSCSVTLKEVEDTKKQKADLVKELGKKFDEAERKLKEQATALYFEVIKK